MTARSKEPDAEWLPFEVTVPRCLADVRPGVRVEFVNSKKYSFCPLTHSIEMTDI